VFLDYDTVSAGDLDLSALRRAADDLTLYETDESKTADRIGGAEVVALNGARLSRELLFGASRLKLVALAATGTDNVDLIAAREQGIAVCNVRAYCTASVVQQAWGLILSLTQHVDDYSRRARSGSWTRDDLATVLTLPIRELQGRVFGVVGWGDLGRGAARVAEAFGMRVLVANRRGESAQPGRMELTQLLCIADILSLHCPLNDSTRSLIGAQELALMKPDALLINTARRVNRWPSARRRAQGRQARRRRYRCPAPRAAVARRSIARSGDPESIADAAHRLGGARSASALHRRTSGEHPGFSQRRPARSSGLTLAAGGPLFSLCRALLFQCLGRLLLFFFLSIHTLAHDLLLYVDQQRTPNPSSDGAPIFSAPQGAPRGGGRWVGGRRTPRPGDGPASRAAAWEASRSHD
jgi:glycerate dehydrogenase